MHNVCLWRLGSSEVLRCVLQHVDIKVSKDRSALICTVKQTKDFLISRKVYTCNIYNPPQYATDLDFTTFKKEKAISQYLLYSQKIGSFCRFKYKQVCDSFKRVKSKVVTLFQNHAMNMKWGAEVKLHAFFISAIDTRHQFRAPVTLPPYAYKLNRRVCGAPVPVWETRQLSAPPSNWTRTLRFPTLQTGHYTELCQLVTFTLIPYIYVYIYIYIYTHNNSLAAQNNLNVVHFTEWSLW